jgi:hypothetical protein
MYQCIWRRKAAQQQHVSASMALNERKQSSGEKQLNNISGA